MFRKRRESKILLTLRRTLLYLILPTRVCNTVCTLRTSKRNSTLPASCHHAIQLYIISYLAQAATREQTYCVTIASSGSFRPFSCDHCVAAIVNACPADCGACISTPDHVVVCSRPNSVLRPSLGDDGVPIECEQDGTIINALARSSAEAR